MNPSAASRAWAITSTPCRMSSADPARVPGAVQVDDGLALGLEVVLVLGFVALAALDQGVQDGVGPGGLGEGAFGGLAVEPGEVLAAEVAGEVCGGEGEGAVTKMHPLVT